MNDVTLCLTIDTLFLMDCSLYVSSFSINNVITRRNIHIHTYLHTYFPKYLFVLIYTNIYLHYVSIGKLHILNNVNMNICVYTPTYTHVKEYAFSYTYTITHAHIHSHTHGIFVYY